MKTYLDNCYLDVISEKETKKVLYLRVVTGHIPITNVEQEFRYLSGFKGQVQLKSFRLCVGDEQDPIHWAHP